MSFDAIHLRSRSLSISLPFALLGLSFWLLLAASLGSCTWAPGAHGSSRLCWLRLHPQHQVQFVVGYQPQGVLQVSDSIKQPAAPTSLLRTWALRERFALSWAAIIAAASTVPFSQGSSKPVPPAREEERGSRDMKCPGGKKRLTGHEVHKDSYLVGRCHQQHTQSLCGKCLLVS